MKSLLATSLAVGLVISLGDAFCPASSDRIKICNDHTATPAAIGRYRPIYRPHQRRRRHEQQQPSPRCQSLGKTALSAVNSADRPSADALLKMVEDLNGDSFSPEVIARMTDLERALSKYLEDERTALKNKPSPRPPLFPPSWNAFLKQDKKETENSSLRKAEQALATLRERLRREEESLRKAEAALKMSLEEEEVLRKAERALQKSKAAAEKRKAEAIRRTEAAVASAQKARLEQEAAQQSLEEETYDYGEFDDDDDEDDFLSRGTRGTIAITMPDLSGDDASSSSKTSTNGAVQAPMGATEVPPGIPIIYNWVQYLDGSISGRVRGSDSFTDGATISTSPVGNGAKGGTIVSTASGSQYFLEKPPTKQGAGSSSLGSDPLVAEQGPVSVTADEAANDAARQILSNNEGQQKKTADSFFWTPMPKTAQAPPGVPSIVNWELREDGGISGLVYGSPNADDGDYIETSAIATGTIESGNVVQTSSGSRYFLSPDKDEKEYNTMAAFKDLAAARRGGTITMSKPPRAKPSDEAMNALQNAKPRTTFSLFELFGGAPKKPTPRPAAAKNAPAGIPTLSEWNENEDGSITGIVHGSQFIDDGDLVTTSPIAQGETKTFATVTTVSGSRYYLLG